MTTTFNVYKVHTRKENDDGTSATIPFKTMWRAVLVIGHFHVQVDETTEDEAVCAALSKAAAMVREFGWTPKREKHER